MREPLVELLVEVPGLPVQVGEFRRFGVFNLMLAEPLSWVANSAGQSAEVWFSPIDKSWRLPGNVRIKAWEKGALVTLDTLTIDLTALILEMSRQAAMGTRLEYSFRRA